MTTSRGLPALVFAAAVIACGSASFAQEGVVKSTTPPVEGVLFDSFSSGCSSCGGGCGSDGCGEGGCVAGRGDCTTCEGNTRLGRLFCAFHNALCCPDPCYQPRWDCAANAGFFTDHARTTTMTRLRWDHGRGLIDPDRSDYFFGSGSFTGNPTVSRVNYNELRMYQEVGTGKFSVFFDLPYRSLETNNRGGAGGIGDLEFGTKSMLIDSELLSFTFQFKTRVPTAAAGSGIGTGSVSLEPSVLTTLKLHTDTYLQSQFSYWFAVGNGSGSIFHTHSSLNHVLFRPLVDTSVIGTFETGAWVFTAGSFRDAAGVVRSANDTAYFTLGPGVRICLCDKLDIGFGMQFAVTNRHFAEQLYRTELRWRF